MRMLPLPDTAVLPVPGAKLVYQVTGDGPAVVLVHGFALDMRMWDPQVADLVRRYRVIRFDCRGFGASGPFDTATAYTHAEDVIALIDHLGIPDAIVVGLSFGGRVALLTALTAPSRVRGLAMLGAVLDGVEWDQESAAGSAFVSRQVAAGGVLAGRAAWLAHPLFAAARERPELASQLTDMVAGYPGQHWLGQDPHRQTQRLLDVLGDVTVPTLVAVGERDVPGFRQMSAVLARDIPGAELHVIGGAGHMINMEEPAAVSAMLLRFLDRVQDGAASALPEPGDDRQHGQEYE
jgi:3-oxoadipate enol-lactonase